MKKIVMSIVLFSLLVFYGFCYSDDVSGKKPEIAPPPAGEINLSLRLPWLYLSGFAGELAAKDLGYFKEQGLNVDVKQGGFDLDPVKLVATGVDQIGAIGIETILIAREKGIPIVGFACEYAKTGMTFFIQQDSNINSVKDFKGKNIGVKYGHISESILDALLKKEKMTRKDIKEVPIKFSHLPFLEKQVDVFPEFIQAQVRFDKEGAKYKMLTPDDLKLNYPGNIYFTTEEFIKKNPDVLVRFLKAIIKGWEWAVENPEKTAELAKKYNEQLDITDQISEFKILMPLIKPKNGKLCWLEKDVLQESQKLLFSTKVIKKNIPIKEAFTWEVLNKVYGKQ